VVEPALRVEPGPTAEPCYRARARALGVQGAGTPSGLGRGRGAGVDQRDVSRWGGTRQGVNRRRVGRQGVERGRAGRRRADRPGVDRPGVDRPDADQQRAGRHGLPGEGAELRWIRNAVGNAAVPELSVVIPSYDEQHAIGACLDSLFDQHDVRLHIVVVANGCHDDTAAVARLAAPAAAARGHHLEVIERTTPGKPGALNAGDDRCRPGPRLYLDADVRLGPGAARELAETLAAGTGTHLAAPAVVVRPPERWLTAAYARVWTQLPYVRTQVIGCGAYAVSAAGRRRWGRFPEIVSDDRFVRLTFGPEEQKVLSTSTFTLALPERPRELFALRARWCRGNRQLARRYPELNARDARRVVPGASYVVRRPSLWLDLPAFGLLFAYGRIRTWSPREPSTTWGRETSSLNRRPDASPVPRLRDQAGSGVLVGGPEKRARSRPRRAGALVGSRGTRDLVDADGDAGSLAPVAGRDRLLGPGARVS
jgi:glycosyltransferase involved in cell wall biosynthesis